MKRRYFIGFLTATMSQISFAQSSVILYGVGDAGIEYLTHANAAGSSLARLVSGSVSGSRWGLRGTEELGVGLKAVFALEAGFDIDTGVSSHGGRLFGRQAWVGMQGNWGTLTLGRHHNVLYDLIPNSEPMLLAGRYSALSIDPTFVGRYDNSVKYTGQFGPLKAVALYSFAKGTSVTSNGATTFAGETPGDMKSDSAFSAGVEYAGTVIGGAVVYDQQQGARGATGQNSSQRDRRIAAGANLTLGSSTILFGYRWFNGDVGVAPGSPSRRNDIYWLGYRYQVSPALSVTAAAYYNDDKRSGRDPWLGVASMNYAFSKRTDAFLTFAYARNKDGSSLGVNGYGSTIGSGMNQTGVMMNLRHKF